MIPMGDLVTNELTALLQVHGVRDVMFCPGSRNASLMHALSRYPMRAAYHPIVDEHSAGFYILGLALAVHREIVVRCTPDTVVANLRPAVAEAYYQGVPLVILSTDRPE